MQSTFWNQSIPGMGQQKPANPYGSGTNATYAQNFDDFFGKGVWGDKGMLDAQSQAGATPQAIAQRTAITQSQPQGGGFGGIQNTVPQAPQGGPGMGAGGANVGAGMGGMGGLGGAPNGFTNNPYYSSMADDITRRVNLSRDQGLSQLRTNMVGVGGLGGARQGVAEGQAISGAADNLAGQLSALGGGMWNSDQNRDLSRYQGDQGFYSAQRGQDLAQVGLGADLIGRGLQAPWGPTNQANSVYGNYTGYGNNTTGGQQANWQTILGGGLAGLQFGNQMGWFK